MTEPPQDDQRPPAPGAPPPHGVTPPYGTPPPYSAPQPYGTQPYGTQPYGPPQYAYAAPSAPGFAPPAQKSRVKLIAGVTAVLLLLIAGAVVLALTLGKTLLDRSAVQRDVAAQFEQREGVGIDIDCPVDMEVENGATYDCKGTTDDGEDVTLRITIDDADAARYSWTEP
jgi:hypothetical protein